MDADVSHFSMAGFELATSDSAALTRSVEPFVQGCPFESMGGSDWLCLVRDASGAELWIGVKRSGEETTLHTLNPAFAGEGRAAVEIVGDVSDPEWKPFEIAVSATFGEDEVPLVFQLSDPRQAALAKPGTRVDVSLSGFSYDAQVFKDEKSYYAEQKKAGLSVAFAANHFIPSGLFNPEAGGQAGDRPTAYAIFAGTVVKSELRTNQSGRGRFWWALVRTYGGHTIDVVLDPDTVKLEPVPGSVISGQFWLTGRLLPRP